MRKAILAMAVVILSFVAFDASACAQCGVHPGNCEYCYENGYDGAQGCVVMGGIVCVLQYPNSCEGYIEQWCPGGHCPDDQEARLDDNSEKEWRLTSVEVIRPKATTSQTGA
jgi:hypothetical protein